MLLFNLPHNQITECQKEVLSFLCKKVKAKNILEIGSWLGESTDVLAREAKNNNGHVYCVDWWRGNPGTNLEKVLSTFDVFKQFNENMRVLGHENIKTFKMSSLEAVHLFEDKYFDLIFIDADHRYQPVKEDILNYQKKLKSGGIICGHDCEGSIYDEKYIDQDCHNSVHHGVCKAVFEMFPEAKIEREVWWIQK